MELATIFLIWLVVTIIDNMSKRKKRLPPQNDSPDFEIPTIEGEEVPIVLENPRQAEIRPKKSEPKKISQPAQLVEESSEVQELDLNLTPSTVMNAFVLNEILGKPKALRRR